MSIYLVVHLQSSLQQRSAAAAAVLLGGNFNAKIMHTWKGLTLDGQIQKQKMLTVAFLALTI